MSGGTSGLLHSHADWQSSMHRRVCFSPVSPCPLSQGRTRKPIVDEVFKGRRLHPLPCAVFLQDAPAVMFCCEDRAIICRECDLMIHTANEFTAKHNRHILFQVAAGLKALPPPGPGRPDSSSQIASDTASAATHMDKAGSLTSIFNHLYLVSNSPSADAHLYKAGN